MNSPLELRKPLMKQLNYWRQALNMLQTGTATNCLENVNNHARLRAEPKAYLEINSLQKAFTFVMKHCSWGDAIGCQAFR